MKQYLSSLTPSILVLFLSILSLSLVIVSGYSFAESDEHDTNEPCHKRAFHKKHGKNLSHMLHKMEHKLELTNEQKDSIQAVIAEYEPQLKSIHEQLRAGKMQGKDIVDNDVLDERNLESFARQQAEIFKQMIVLKSKAIHEMHAHLTQEQRETVQRIFSKEKGQVFKNDAVFNKSVTYM